LTAQRVRLQAISSNMANARSTRTDEGTPYRRQMPVFQAVEANSFGSELAQQLSRVEVVEVERSQAPFREVFDPGHPDADEDGYVKYPNVDILHEMVDLMNTSRSYEANSNVTETTYKMANQALELGR
jgi:flagellar basal-body rod protein FlgC